MMSYPAALCVCVCVCVCACTCASVRVRVRVCEFLSVYFPLCENGKKNKTAIAFLFFWCLNKKHG